MPAPYRALSNYAVGTVSVANGQSTATLTNAFVRVQDQAREYWLVRPDDLLVIDGVGATFVRDVDAVLGAADATLALTAPWPHATQTAVAYRIVRFSQVSDGEARSLLQTLLSKGGASAPDIARYFDDSQASMRVGPYAGVPSMRVGPTGAADGAMFTAVAADPTTGAVSFPNGVKGWALTGFRNRLRNASFAINQRGVAGTVTLAAGQYGHDGVKAGADGATYTFATNGIDVGIAISAGSLIMPIEASMIEGGSYALSHDGTALMRVWHGAGYSGSGSYIPGTRAAPILLSGFPAATQTNVEFASGTILRPQFEPGAAVQAYERQHPAVELMLCERYYQRIIGWGGGWQFGPNDLAVTGRFRTTMAAVPTIILVNGTQGVEQYSWSFQNILSILATTVNADGGSMLLSTSTANQGSLGGITIMAKIYAKAEL